MKADFHFTFTPEQQYVRVTATDTSTGHTLTHHGYLKISDLAALSQHARQEKTSPQASVVQQKGAVAIEGRKLHLMEFKKAQEYTLKLSSAEIATMLKEIIFRLDDLQSRKPSGNRAVPETMFQLQPSTAKKGEIPHLNLKIDQGQVSTTLQLSVLSLQHALESSEFPTLITGQRGEQLSIGDELKIETPAWIVRLPIDIRGMKELKRTLRQSLPELHYITEPHPDRGGEQKEFSAALRRGHLLLTKQRLHFTLEHPTNASILALQGVEWQENMAWLLVSDLEGNRRRIPSHAWTTAQQYSILSNLKTALRQKPL